MSQYAQRQQEYMNQAYAAFNQFQDAWINRVEYPMASGAMFLWNVTSSSTGRPVTVQLWNRPSISGENNWTFVTITSEGSMTTYSTVLTGSMTEAAAVATFQATRQW